MTSCLSTLLLSLLDYKEGFGGKFGVQKVQDKSAVGWDHKEAQQQHDSQKGDSVQKVSVVCCTQSSRFEQITRRALEASLVSRQTEWTSQPTAGNITRKLISTSLKKV